MKRENIFLIVMLSLAAVFLAFSFWPKDGRFGEGEQTAKIQEGENSKEQASSEQGENNQLNTEQKNMETKLDGSVNEEITPAQGPVMQIDKEADYAALLKTSAGDIKIRLNTAETPITVNNFVYLARKGFYDDTIFHRTINGFMIQGGDPLGNGTGGPGYQFDDEPFTGQYSRGIVAMANAGANTNGSQFFIMHQEVLLQPNYVIFGEVIEGMDIVDKIAEAPAKANVHGEISVPVDPVKILSAEVYQVLPAE
ncbi:MAG: peptidylprolyl isomerase [Candidatus Pacebacteria bacterium]|nr:peptidylprolyl isomerase [Candidatus Paceibacterota bacterium]MDD4875207.1 peptidylprolyl isomerase [Candidatus Paceibacterota bacterium]